MHKIEQNHRQSFSISDNHGQSKQSWQSKIQLSPPCLRSSLFTTYRIIWRMKTSTDDIRLLIWEEESRKPVMVAHECAVHVIIRHMIWNGHLRNQENQHVIAANESHLIRPMSKVETGWILVKLMRMSHRNSEDLTENVSIRRGTSWLLMVSQNHSCDSELCSSTKQGDNSFEWLLFSDQMAKGMFCEQSSRKTPLRLTRWALRAVTTRRNEGSVNIHEESMHITAAGALSLWDRNNWYRH